MHASWLKEQDKLPEVDALVLPVWEGETKSARFDDVHVRFAMTSGDFCAKPNQTQLVYPAKPSKKCPRVLLLGLGNKGEAEPETLRRAYAIATKGLCQLGLTKAAFLLPPTRGDEDLLCAAAVQGVFSANYVFDALKCEVLREERRRLLEKAVFVGRSSRGREIVARTEDIADGVYFARDLVNGNADDVHVGTLSKCARDLERESNAVKVTVLEGQKLEKLKMGLLLAVGQGAARGPALIIIEYRGDPKSKDKTAIVGKGITYDTGGLNLKPTGGIETMKCDMAGTATTLGVMHAAARLKLKRNLIGVLAVAENAIGPKSYKPGDVVKSYSGKTVEIGNTDAEGRLVLADALSYIQETYRPSRIIDLATLTGGIVVALGEEATGLFSNDDALALALANAGACSGERLWRMPIYPEYKEMLKSQIADIKNCGPRKASSATAALFLQEFIHKGTAWAHLDIAGTAFLSEPKPYQTSNATGVGVRLLIEYLSSCK